MLWYCDRATIKSLSVPFNCHFLFRILCRDAITAPPKKKRKTTESTTDIHVSKPRTPRSTRSVYQRNPATVSISYYTRPSTDSNRPILAENNTGTTPNMNIGYTRLAEEIIRLQNSGNMGGVQPASSGNICTDSLTATTSSFLASDTEFSSGQLRSHDHNSLTTVPQTILHLPCKWTIIPPIQITHKWHLPPIWYFHFTPYQKRALAVFSANPFCLRKYFSWKGVHRTYKLYYAMIKIIKMIMLCNNVLCNSMHSLFSCKM